jgi:MoxR-like ATPase
MAERLTIEEIREGAVMEATFWANPVADSRFRFRATHLDGRRAPKVVLCDDARIHPGVAAAVKIVAVHKRDRQDHGFIEVAFVRSHDLRIKGVYLDPQVSRKLQILLESGLNILLDGPQGCGKTVLARAIAQTLGLEFVFFNCSAVIEATDFLATVQVESGQPVTDFIPTDLLTAMEAAKGQPERRVLVFLDEFNRCPESARNVLMPALDATRKVFNPITNAFLEIPDNVQFIAAVNRGREFSGTFGIDAAQLDRFAPLQMDYLPPKEEVKLLQSRHPELSHRLLRLLVDIADRVRSSPELHGGLSVRATEEACIYLKHPLMQGTERHELPEVLKSSYCGRFPGRWDDPSSDAGIVWGLINDVIGEEAKKEARR